MSQLQCPLVELLGLVGAVGHQLDGELYLFALVNGLLKPLPPLGEGKVDQPLAVDVEDVKEVQLEGDFLYHLVDVVLPSKPPEDELEGPGPSALAHSDEFALDDDLFRFQAF